jgi:hypothetical protein
MEVACMRKLAVTISLILIMFISGCRNTAGMAAESSYPALVAWNFIVYGLSVETIPFESIEAEIGQVKRLVGSIPRQNGDANDAPIGSKLYRIKDVSLQDAIAVGIDGKCYKAYRSGPLLSSF